MGEARHLHFNLLTGAWLLIFLTVALPAYKYALARWHVPGWSELVSKI